MFLVWAPLRGRAFLRFLGWGGVGGCNNVHVSCVQGEATWMLRRCYVDHTLLLRWGDVDATVGVGWGGVGWGGGGVITFMSLACKVLRRGCYVDVTLIMRWLYVDLALLIRWCYFDHAPWCYVLIGWCYVDDGVGFGWGGVGWVWGGFVLGIVEVSYQVAVSDIQVFCSTSCQKLMMDFKLYICYAADGYYI